MLYKFKSKDHGDVIMLEANGRRVLEIIGKHPGPTGIILPEQMPAAIKALEDAIWRLCGRSDRRLAMRAGRAFPSPAIVFLARWLRCHCGNVVRARGLD